MFGWIEIIGFNSEISFLREYVSPLKSWLPSWVYFSLPDGLWVYSFTSIILILWAGKINYWLIIPFITGVLVEILQGFTFIGTFDYLDLAFSILGISTSILIINRKYKQNEKQKQVY
jgi:glycopeptide antibiotics resistance protein